MSFLHFNSSRHTRPPRLQPRCFLGRAFETGLGFVSKPTQARRASFEVALAWISPQIVTRRVSEEAYRVASFLANASGYEKCATSKRASEGVRSNDWLRLRFRLQWHGAGTSGICRSFNQGPPRQKTNGYSTRSSGATFLLWQAAEQVGRNKLAQFRHELPKRP